MTMAQVRLSGVFIRYIINYYLVYTFMLARRELEHVNVDTLVSK
jgi:hypothetical protein